LIKLLLVGLQNIYDGNTILFKIIIEDGVITTTAIINFQRHVKILCSYDMDVDGFYDILYIDEKNNVTCIYLALCAI
jgi:hypothetical protein